MATTYTRRINLYINGREVRSSSYFLFNSGTFYNYQ
jgi:hypothetical protein